MSAKIIDGKAVAQSVKDELKEKVSALPYKITLAVVKVGNDPASEVYVRNKIKACEYTGIVSLSVNLPENVSQQELEKEVTTLVENGDVDGVLVQLPLPKGLDEEKVISLIPPEKDVDGFSDENMGKTLAGKPCAVACTPKGVIRLIESTGVDLNGKSAVVVGRSNNVGKPIATLLLNKNCTVTVCHSKTKNISDYTKTADILAVAVGKPKFVTADMVKNGAIVIDIGINRTENGLVGDTDFSGLLEKASYITPVPGGVGPMTVAMLMQNTYELALRRRK